MNPDSTADFLVIGGGIVGLTIAIELRRRFPDCSVVLLEKEPRCGMHASGRNSGVLHAGFYYTADSLKARFTREGCRLLTEYCESRSLAIDRCGKLVVAQQDSELAQLEELLRRGLMNGVELQQVTESEAREIEPRARTVKRALFSPSTATVDSREVIRSLAEDARRGGVSVATGERFLQSDGAGGVVTDRRTLHVGYLVNAAGLHADRIAHQHDLARDYRILPFRGRYLVTDRPESRLNVHVYPVPRLDYPFLGVHFTKSLGGRTKIGPTATPALWREHYSGMERFDAVEMAQTLSTELRVLASDRIGFGRLAREGIGRLRRKDLVASASLLLAHAEKPEGWTWGRTGVRAQLVNRRTRRLEMDFIVEEDEKSLHVLNAVSPAFTCAPALAPYFVDRIAESATAGTAVH